MSLEEEFQQEALESCRILSRKHRYNPTYFLQMLQDEGGAVAAAKRLLAGEDVQYGFSKLWKLGRLDLSVEAMVLNPKYRRLFTEEQLKEARKRLDKVDYAKIP